MEAIMGRDLQISEQEDRRLIDYDRIHRAREIRDHGQREGGWLTSAPQTRPTDEPRRNTPAELPDDEPERFPPDIRGR
jgi:hypothetical protein